MTDINPSLLNFAFYKTLLKTDTDCKMQLVSTRSKPACAQSFQLNW